MSIDAAADVVVEPGLFDAIFDTEYAFSTYPHIPVSDYARRRWTAVIITVCQAFWAALKFYTIVGKLVEFDDTDFVDHYTNWSWVIQTLFQMSIIGCTFVQVGWIRHDSALATWYRFVFALFFFPVLGIVMVVRVLVWLLLASGSLFFVQFMETMAPSLVMMGDDAFHFGPVLEMLLIALVFRKFILESCNWLIASTHMLDSPSRYTLYLFYNAYGLALATLIVYRLLYNPHDIYLTNLPDILGFVVIVLVLTLFVLLVELFVFWLLGVARRKRYTIEWFHRNDADPYVVGVYEFQSSKDI